MSFGSIIGRGTFVYRALEETSNQDNGLLTPGRDKIGLVAGLGVSVFSKPLALLIGVLVVGLQTAENYGIHLIPYRSMQKYVKGMDLRSAVQDNVAFKISFGTMFALSAFAEF